MTQPSREAVHDLVPGFPDDLCLGFANTRYYRGTDPATETLTELDALLAWCRSATLLSPSGEKALRRAWRDDAKGAAVFQYAIALRETVCPSFFCTAAGKAPTAAEPAA